MDYKIEMWMGELESGLNEDDLDYMLARALKHSDVTVSVTKIISMHPSHDEEV